jgi:hypothetical protein
VLRHLEALVGVLVVHVVDDVHGVHVDAGEPVHHPFEPADDVVEIEHVTLHGPERRADLLAADLVASPVDRVEQTLGEVGPGAEELHLLADAHR